MIFSWDDWNIRHIVKHAVSRKGAEYVVRRASPPFPREVGEDKYTVWGATADGRYLQVIFAYRREEDIDHTSVDPADLIELSEGVEVVAVYVIHAMPMTANMLKQYRRLRR